MIKLLFLLLPLFLYAQSPFESLEGRNFDLSLYETKKDEINKQIAKNRKITCRYVCDKKVYKEQKISDAVEFYKKSKYHGFSMD